VKASRVASRARADTWPVMSAPIAEWLPAAELRVDRRICTDESVTGDRIRHGRRPHSVTDARGLEARRVQRRGRGSKQGGSGSMARIVMTSFGSMCCCEPGEPEGSPLPRWKDDPGRSTPRAATRTIRGPPPGVVPSRATLERRRPPGAGTFTDLACWGHSSRTLTPVCDTTCRRPSLSGRTT
jgi:hypothetical protein